MLVIQTLSIPVMTEKATRELEWLACSAHARGALWATERTAPPLSDISQHIPGALHATADLPGLKQATNIVTKPTLVLSSSFYPDEGGTEFLYLFLSMSIILEDSVINLQY